MKVRFARWLSVLLMVLGAVPLLLGLRLWSQGSAEGGLPTALAGLALFAFGLVYLWIPYFYLADGRLVVPILRGPKAQTAIPARARVDASGDRLTMTVGTRRTDLPVRRAMAHSGDWATLQDRLVRDAEAR